MNKLEILTKLTGLVAGGTSKAVIERDAGLPKNSLSSVLTGVKEMPNKWVEKFGGYFEKMEVKAEGIQSVQTAVNTLLGTGAIKASHGFHDITCSANPAEPMGSEGCSCEMYRRAKKAETENQTLKIEIEWRDTMINELKTDLEGQNKPNTALKTEKEGKTTAKQEKGSDEAESGPKTLEDVKDMCPKHLSGLDRSIWIAENRKKYNV